MREPRGLPAAHFAVLAFTVAVVTSSTSSCRRSPEVGGAEAVRVSAYPALLPEGPGRDIAERSCLSCHSATLLTQQAKDSTAWAKTLGTMEKWSAPVPPPQRDSLLTYLVARLGSGRAR